MTRAGILNASAAVLAAATALPLWRTGRWWVRALEFPRLQLTVLAGLALAAELQRRRSEPASPTRLAVLSGCVAYHAWWILPYTPWYPHEVPAAEPASTWPTLAILGANVLTPNRNADRLLAIIRSAGPDVVVAVETDAWWERHLDTLVAEYPHVVRCAQDNLYGMHVYSRLPLEDVQLQFLVEPGIPSVHALVVLADGRRVRLHCLHPRPPAPQEATDATARDAELVVVGHAVRGSDEPVVVTGDLNDVGWSETTRLFRKISRLLDPRIGRGMFNTFHAGNPLLRWPLDHLFHSGHFSLVAMRRLDAFGSDHFPIFVQLALENRPQAAPAIARTADDERRARDLEDKAGVAPADVHQPGT